MRVHPWNRALWDRLVQERDRLPHALLLHGMAGVGKRQLARTLAQWLLCETPGPEGGCGRCRSCVWLAQGGHPDLRVVEPKLDDAEGEKAKKGKRLITVGDVREVLDFLALSAHQGGWRVVLVEPAEAMNSAAANALLKTLEEPPPGVMLILVSHQPRRLLPTVLSRCRKLPVSPPDRDTALAWLAEQGLEDAEQMLREAGGAPLLAMDIADSERRGWRDRFLAALAGPAEQDWSELAQAMQPRLADAWGWLTRWVCDLIACHAGASARYFPQHAAALTHLAGRADTASLWTLYQELQAAGRWLHHPLNNQLQLESWLLRYASLEVRK